jgi:hypothetical protein
MLSKKYHEDFVILIKNTKTREGLIEALIQYCAYDNSRFDTKKFREAIKEK